jgi:hypothetical protein
VTSGLIGEGQEVRALGIKAVAESGDHARYLGR